MDRSITGLKHSPAQPRVREVDDFRPLFWLRLGWEDLREHALASVAYGFFFALTGYLILHHAADKPHLIIVAISGFLLVGPILAAGLYEISRRSAARQTAGLLVSLRGIRRKLGTLAPMGLLLALMILAWERTTAWIFSLIHPEQLSDISSLMSLMLSSSAHVGFSIAYLITGLLFALFVFCTTVVTVPMLMDRDATIGSAMLTSLRTVYHNPKAMLLWASLITLTMLIGFATLMIGLILLIPLIGHASWHAYRDIVD